MYQYRVEKNNPKGSICNTKAAAPGPEQHGKLGLAIHKSASLLSDGTVHKLISILGE